MSLLLWVACTKFGCKYLQDYVNDIFSSEVATNLLLYPQYHSIMPQDQVHLLECLDAIDFPHDCIKQLYGKSLPVIGLEVNGNELQITMPATSKFDLVNTLDSFCQSAHQTLCQCQAIAGYVSWVLKVFPKLCLGLASLYSKTNPNRSVTINAQIRHDLLWLTTKI